MIVRCQWTLLLRQFYVRRLLQQYVCKAFRNVIIIDQELRSKKRRGKSPYSLAGVFFYSESLVLQAVRCAIKVFVRVVTMRAGVCAATGRVELPENRSITTTVVVVP